MLKHYDAEDGKNEQVRDPPIKPYTLLGCPGLIKLRQMCVSGEV